MNGQASKARVLYKTILKLHRGLPQDVRKFGDEYIRGEFKHHKTADASFLPVFYREWTKYTKLLSKQLGGSMINEKLGLGLTENQLSNLSDEQVSQLYELYQETQGTSNSSNPDHCPEKQTLN